MFIAEKFEKIVLILALVIFGVPSRSNAELITHLDVNKEDLNVAVRESRDVSKPDFKNELNRVLTITLENRRNLQTKEIVWKGPLRKINDSKFCSSNKILLMGEIPFSGSSSGGNNIIVLDSEICVVQDTIRCYDYSLSPSKRFLVYETWYPRMVSPDFRKSILLIYDLTETEAANRLPFSSKYTYKNAGLPIFPEANAYYAAFDPNDLEDGLDVKMYNVNLDDKYSVMSPFLWSNNENLLVFFVFNHNEQNNYLIKIDLTNGISNPIILRKLVNMADLIKWDVILDVTKEELVKKAYKFGVESIRWHDSKKKIIVEPYPQYWLDAEIDVSLPLE